MGREMADFHVFTNRGWFGSNRRTKSQKDASVAQIPQPRCWIKIDGRQRLSLPLVGNEDKTHTHTHEEMIQDVNSPLISARKSYQKKKKSQAGTWTDAASGPPLAECLPALVPTCPRVAPQISADFALLPTSSMLRSFSSSQFRSSVVFFSYSSLRQEDNSAQRWGGGGVGGQICGAVNQEPRWRDGVLGEQEVIARPKKKR